MTTPEQVPHPIDHPCLHCERRPRVTPRGLCAECHAVKNVRKLYVRRRGWTPAWDEHLVRLTERARDRRPLFHPLLATEAFRRTRPDETIDERRADDPPRPPAAQLAVSRGVTAAAIVSTPVASDEHRRECDSRRGRGSIFDVRQPRFT